MAIWFARAPLANAEAVLVGMPYDRTSSHRPGSRFGPDALRVGAENIESYSPYQLRDAAGLGLHDCGNILFEFATPESPLATIAEVTRGNYEAGRRQLALGGEHTITPAIVAELVRRFPGLAVIQFDAHSDLRDTYLSEAWCHATAMARVLEYVPRHRLFQLGIRSFADGDEMTRPGVYPFQVLEPVADVKAAIGDLPVYLTLDVDVLDPGILPDVQTPEPGGCSFRELARALADLSDRNVVGADVVEFNPRTEWPAAGASTVAELVREVALMLCPGKGPR